MKDISFARHAFLNPSAKLDLHYNGQINRGDISPYRDPVLLLDIGIRGAGFAFPTYNIQQGLVEFSLKFATIRPADSAGELRISRERPM